MSLEINLEELMDDARVVDAIESKFCEILGDLAKMKQKRAAQFYLQEIVDFINAIDDDFPLDSVLDIVAPVKKSK